MKTLRLGVLMTGDESYPAYAAFLDELAIAGEKSDLVLETIVRFAAGRHELLPSLAADIAASKPDLVVAIGAVSHYAIRAVVGHTVPIIFAIVIDPVAAGIVPQKRKRGGNVTGATSFDPKQASQQIRLLKETVCDISTLAVVGDADVPPFLARLAEAAAVAHGLRPVIRLLRSQREIGSAVAYFLNEGATGLLGLEVPRINTHCIEITEAATAAGIPTVLGSDMPRASPLLAFGCSLSAATRRAAELAIRVAQGNSPADLPIEYTRGKTLTVNLSTARRLGIEVPKSVLDTDFHIVA